MKYLLQIIKSAIYGTALITQKTGHFMYSVHWF